MKYKNASELNIDDFIYLIKNENVFPIKVEKLKIEEIRLTNSFDNDKEEIKITCKGSSKNYIFSKYKTSGYFYLRSMGKMPGECFTCKEAFKTAVIKALRNYSEKIIKKISTKNKDIIDLSKMHYEVSDQINKIIAGESIDNLFN